MPYDYVSWQVDHQIQFEGEDFEWDAHLIVVAATPEAAEMWGDHLTIRMCALTRNVFLRSTVEPHSCDVAVIPGVHHACPNCPPPPGGWGFKVPVVLDGVQPTSEFIGW